MLLRATLNEQREQAVLWSLVALHKLLQASCHPPTCSSGAAAAKPSKLSTSLPLMSSINRLGNGPIQLATSASRLLPRRREVRRAPQAGKWAARRAAPVRGLPDRSRERSADRPVWGGGTRDGRLFASRQPMRAWLRQLLSSGHDPVWRYQGQQSPHASPSRLGSRSSPLQEASREVS